MGDLTVDTAHLLAKHDGGSCKCRSADSWNLEEVKETLEVVTLLDELVFNFQLSVNVIQVTRRL